MKKLINMIGEVLTEMAFYFLLCYVITYNHITVEVLVSILTLTIARRLLVWNLNKYWFAK